MQIAKHSVVTIDYTLKDPKGQVLDSSTAAGREPLTYLHGTGNGLIPGLEKALTGKKKGETFNVKVNPDEGYGNRDETMVQTVPKSAFGSVSTLTVGMQFRTQGKNGDQVVTVTKIDGDNVTVDGNHTLAGMPLEFDVTIKDVRAASKEEIAHGHVHGPGGHHHH